MYLLSQNFIDTNDKEVQQDTWCSIATYYTTYTKTYILYEISTKEYEPKEFTVYHGTFQHINNA